MLRIFYILIFPDGSNSTLRINIFDNSNINCFTSKKIQDLMEKIIHTLPAHYDGKSIVLDKPFVLSKNDRLLVTVLQDNLEEDESKEWLDSSMSFLNSCFSADEPEYNLSMIREPNPKYNK